MNPQSRSVQLAVELFNLGVSHAGVVELLCYDHDIIERQLAYLPYRNAKRPGAFIVDAIRNNYSPPNLAPYATTQNNALQSPSCLDQDSQRPARQTPPDA